MTVTSTNSDSATRVKGFTRSVGHCRSLTTAAALSVELGRVALDLASVISEITEHQLDQAAVDLLTSARAHLQLEFDRLDEAVYEVELHGRSYPDGKPPLRLAGDPEFGLGRAA